MAYKGLMLSDIPNFAFIIGYTNASWTLKADLVCEYVVKVLAHMQKVGARTVVARRDPNVTEEPFLDFEAGYVMRSIDALPKQGATFPWRLKMNYFRDVLDFRRPVADDVLEFRP